MSQSGNGSNPSSHSLHFLPLTLGLQGQSPISSQPIDSDPSSSQKHSANIYNNYKLKIKFVLKENVDNEIIMIFQTLLYHL